MIKNTDVYGEKITTLQSNKEDKEIEPNKYKLTVFKAWEITYLTW